MYNFVHCMQMRDYADETVQLCTKTYNYVYFIRKCVIMPTKLYNFVPIII